MRVLVVQNYNHTDLGLVGAALAEAGAEIDLRRAHQDEALPHDASGHDALVVLGGGQNALDDDRYPYIPGLLALMKDFAESDRAVLGICLGSQLLARAYGATNLIGAAPEFGWCAVTRSDEGEGDPVLAAAPRAAFPIFQWHDDTFTLPPGAVRLAGNEIAENQAFRVGRAAYGFQFHFEADRTLVRRWSSDFADWLAEKQPDWPARIDAESERHGAAADAAGMALARAWVALI